MHTFREKCRNSSVDVTFLVLDFIPSHDLNMGNKSLSYDRAPYLGMNNRVRYLGRAQFCKI